MKVIAKNRRAIFDYAIEEKITVGIVLTGAEAKSIRNGQVNLKGSFSHIRGGELWIFNMYISPYAFAENKDYDPTRPRKLLITKRELQKMRQAQESHRSLVPLVVLSGRYVKLEIGIGKGKKKHDKRHAIKQRDIERDIRRKNE